MDDPNLTQLIAFQSWIQSENSFDKSNLQYVHIANSYINLTLHCAWSRVEDLEIGKDRDTAIKAFYLKKMYINPMLCLKSITKR